MKKLLLASIGFWTLLWASPVPGQETAAYKLIVHPASSVSALSRLQAKKMFLKKETKWPNGQKVLPVDLKASSSTRRVFSKKVIGKSVSSIKSFWQQQIFSGRGVPPPEKRTEKLVLAYVLANPGAIGYVSASANTGRAKVLAVGN